MISRVLWQLQHYLSNIERNLYYSLSLRNLADEVCLLMWKTDNSFMKYPPAKLEIDIVEESILWAVPKSRKSIEKRLQKKFGWPQYVWKPLISKKNLLTCRSCGDHHKAGFLCSSCYSKVKKETEDMQKLIEKEVGLKPDDQRIFVLYKGESEDLVKDYRSKHLVVEMPRERPQWFGRNLLEKTSKEQTVSGTSKVKPTDLA